MHVCKSYLQSNSKHTITFHGNIKMSILTGNTDHLSENIMCVRCVKFSFTYVRLIVHSSVKVVN